MSLIADALKTAETERARSARSQDAAREILGGLERRAAPIRGAAEWLYRPIRVPRHVRAAGAIVAVAIGVSTTIVAFRPATGENDAEAALAAGFGSPMLPRSDGQAHAAAELPAGGAEPEQQADAEQTGTVAAVPTAPSTGTASEESAGQAASAMPAVSTSALSEARPSGAAPPVAESTRPAEQSAPVPLGASAPELFEERRQLSSQELQVEASTRANGELFTAAVSAQQSRDYSNAISLYEQILERDRNDVEVLNNLGVSYQATGQLEAARNSFQRALDIQPRYAAAWSNLGVALNALGQEVEARAAFGEAIRRDPGNLGTKVNLALLHQRQGLASEAKRLLQEVVGINGSMAEAHFGLAGIFEAEGNYSAALRHYRLFIATSGGRFPQYEPLVAERMRRLEGGR